MTDARFEIIPDRDRKVKSTGTGYFHPAYVKSLVEFGKPYNLPRSRAWILKRPITGTSYHDGMGCYPLFTCEKWEYLIDDLDNIGSDLVTLSIVTDPFGNYDEAYLKNCFPDVCKPFKQHYVTDLRRPPRTFISEHHKRNLRKVHHQVTVDICEHPAAYLDEWIRLYSNLIKRRNIQGVRAFSRQSFEKQLQVPGVTLLKAVNGGVIEGMLLWYICNKIAYYHLGAYSDMGYKSGASFSLFLFAIEYFEALGTRWLDLGAGAGLGNDSTDGLSRFKRGWSTGTRNAYFCGRVLNRAAYDKIVTGKLSCHTDYFPAYRKGEFV